MLRLDTNKLYYRPSTGDKPPVVYTLGEIASMMEKAGSWRVESHRRRPCVGIKCQEGGCDDVDNATRETETRKQGAATPGATIVDGDKVYYCRELKRKITYAEMLDGIDPEMWLQDEDELELELLLWAFDAEEAA